MRAGNTEKYTMKTDSLLVTECPKCGKKTVQSLGKPEQLRYYCYNQKCKAQCDKGVWYTWDEWELLINCGICRNRDNDECKACVGFNNWKSDNMDSKPLPKDWQPKFYEESTKA